MKTIELKGSARETGKTAVKKQRRDGNIPCVMYGDDAPVHFFVNEVQLKNALWTPEVFIVKLDVDGKQAEAIIRDAQFHPVTDRVVHVDFLTIGDKPVELELPVRLTGTSPGVIEGGRLQQLLRKIRVKGIPAKLPDSFEVSIADLQLGKSIKIADLQSEVEILTDPGVAIASVKVPRQVVEVVEAEDGEEGAEGAEGEGGEGAAPKAEGGDAGGGDAGGGE